MTKKNPKMARLGRENGRWEGGTSKTYYRRIAGCKPNDGKVVHHETGKYKNPKKSDLEVISPRGRISALGMHNKEHPEKGGDHMNVASRREEYDQNIEDYNIPTQEEIESEEEALRNIKSGKPPKSNKPWYMDKRRRYPPGSKYRGEGNVYGGRDELGNRQHKGITFEPYIQRKDKREIYKILRKSRLAYSNYYRIYSIKAPVGKATHRENKVWVLYVGPPKPSHGRIVTKPSRRQLYEKQKRRYEKALVGQQRRRWR